MSKLQDLTGQKFGRLTVIKRAENLTLKCGRQKIQWLCKCDCENTIVVLSESLKSGHTQSCGCLCGQHHGKHGTKLYGIWKGIKYRCGNPNCKSYRIYGAEGKTVCDEWLNDFQAFYDWAMETEYKEGLTLERIDGNKGYSPDNCKWADRTEQANNTRKNRFITYNGETKTIAQWAKTYNLCYTTLYWRLQNNWSMEKALTTK